MSHHFPPAGAARALVLALLALAAEATAADNRPSAPIGDRISALGPPLEAHSAWAEGRRQAACLQDPPSGACEAATAVALAARQRVEALALLARCLSAPASAEARCAAEPLQAALAPLEAAVKATVSDLLDQAQSAPATADAVVARAKVARAAAVAASSYVLTALKDGLNPGGGVSLAANAQAARTALTAAEAAATEAETEAKKAEGAAQALVLRSLRLAACTPGPDGLAQCSGGTHWPTLVADGLLALGQLQAVQESVERHVRTARENAWTAQTAHVKGAAQKKRAIRFIELIDDNADAASLGGQDAAALSASTAGSTASLRFSADRKGSASVNRFNVVFSTPLDADKARTDLWRRSPDGLAGRPKVELGYTRLVLAGDDSPAFFGFGASLASAREELDYIDKADLSKLKSVRSSPLSLGAHVVVAPNVDGAPLLALRVERQRKSDSDGDPTTVCAPVPAEGESTLNCLSGVVGAPQRRYWNVVRLGMQRLNVRDAFDMGLSVTYNSTKHKTEVEIPIYLVKSGDEADKGKRNAGISLSWANKGGGLAIGVFVGTPLSLKILNGAP